MKHMKRLLAVLLAAVCFMSVSCLPACPALAEEAAAVQEAPAPEPPKPEPPAPKPDPTKAPEPDPTKAPEPDPTKAPEPDPTEAPEPDPTEAPAPEEPDAPESTDAPEAAPDATPAPESTPEITLEPTVQPEAPEITPAPTQEGDIDPELTPEPEITPEPELTPEPTPTPTPMPTSAGLELLPRSSAWADLHLDPANLRIPGDGMPIPVMLQRNYKTPVCKYDGDTKNVHSSGCGAVAASMAIAYVNQDYDQTPYTLFYTAVKNGNYRGDGLDYGSVRAMLTRRGIDARMETMSSANILDALRNFRPVIIKMGPGTFTSGGHYILLRGLDADGRVLVNDPASSGRSADSFSAKLIAQEAKGDEMIVIHDGPAGVVHAQTPAPEAEPVATPVPMPTPTPAPTAVPEPVFSVEDMPAPVDYLRSDAYPACVEADRANLRTGPGREFAVAAIVDCGTALAVSGEEMGADGWIWCAVSYGSQTLYIRSDLIRDMI